VVRKPCFSAALLLAGAMTATAADPSPAGLWKTFDDHTHKARGTILIFEENGVFFGRIESSFNPAELTERCHKCSGDRKDAPVIGLIIMRGMTRHGDEFEGGDILDPETGTTYHCRLSLSSDGMKLMVRGYIGFSLFGRTQTWVRIGDGPVTPASETPGHSLASVTPESAK
jgi:uncharacterized protein (DUF2147 family)